MRSLEQTRKQLRDFTYTPKVNAFYHDGCWLQPISVAQWYETQWDGGWPPQVGYEMPMPLLHDYPCSIAYTPVHNVDAYNNTRFL